MSGNFLQFLSFLIYSKVIVLHLVSLILAFVTESVWCRNKFGEDTLRYYQ